MLNLRDTMLFETILPQPVLKELLAFIIIGTSFFLHGLTFTLDAFSNVGEDGVTATQESISSSFSLLMGFFGSLLIANIMNKFGRKKAIQFGYLMYILAGGSILFYNKEKYYFFYISRVLSGFGNSSPVAALLYISEVSHKSRRGIFASSAAMISTTGCLISYILQYNYHINVVGFFTGIIASMFLLLSYIIPETKYWYLIKNQLEDAQRSSLWFDSHQTQEQMIVEFECIVDEVSDNENTTTFTYLRQWQNLKKFLFCQILLFSRALCGRSPISIIPDYFYSSFHLKFDAKKLTLGEVLFGFVSSIVALSVMGKLNRRASLAFSISILISLLSLIITCNIFIDLINKFCPWLEVICWYLYSSIMLTYVLPVTNLIVVELVSSSNKKRASILTFSMSFISLYLAINAFVFPLCVENYGIALPLSYFMLGNIIMLIIVLFFLPETNNKALYECGKEKREIANDISKPLLMRFEEGSTSKLGVQGS